MKTLLIQLRPKAAIRDHEYGCFLRQSGLQPEQVVRLSAVDDLPSHRHLEEVSSVVVGGSGAYLLSAGHIPEVIQATGEVMQEARRRRVPLLGICFGAQILAQHFGGEVVLDVENQEIGTFSINKHKATEDCPIFSDLPASFDVQLGHKDAITRLPEGAVNLAWSDRAAVQAFHFPGEPTYGFVFHPELTVEDVYQRLDYVAADYSLSEEKREALKQATRHAEHGARPLQRFFEHIVQKRALSVI